MVTAFEKSAVAESSFRALTFHRNVLHYKILYAYKVHVLHGPLRSTALLLNTPCTKSRGHRATGKRHLKTDIFIYHKVHVTDEENLQADLPSRCQ